ncbi:MAG: Rid family detoxifying hydrolase [Bacteroidales bacterium]|nr:Rid family detoxifying hydrolase [Bacteroidales bacterium]
MSRKDPRINELYSPNIPEPRGHYSQAVQFNDLIFVSGQLPVNPFTGEPVKGDIEEQALQVLENIETILKDSGSDKRKILKTTVYISNMSHWPRVNEVYMKFFGKHKPARAVVPTKELHYGVLIEIEAVAAI